MTKGYRNVIDYVRDQKQLLGAIVSVVVMTIGALAWANSEFVTTAKASEMMEKTQHADLELSKQIVGLSKQVEKSNQILLTHIDRYTLDSVKSDIKTNQSETFALEQFMRVNGADARSESRLQNLKTDLSELELKKTCIINHNPLCD